MDPNNLEMIEQEIEELLKEAESLGEQCPPEYQEQLQQTVVVLQQLQMNLTQMKSQTMQGRSM